MKLADGVISPGRKLLKMSMHRFRGRQTPGCEGPEWACVSHQVSSRGRRGAVASRVFSPGGAACTLHYVTARPWRLCLTAISACPIGSPPGEPSATMRCCRRGEHPLVRKHGWVGCIVGRSRKLVRYAG